MGWGRGDANRRHSVFSLAAKGTQPGQASSKNIFSSKYSLSVTSWATTKSSFPGLVLSVPGLTHVPPSPELASCHSPTLATEFCVRKVQTLKIYFYENRQMYLAVKDQLSQCTQNTDGGVAVQKQSKHTLLGRLLFHTAN